jgi:hypothetical protein
MAWNGRGGRKSAPANPLLRSATDIETYAEATYPEDDRQPPKSKKTDEDREEWRVEDRRKWETDQATSFLTARVCCVAIVTPERRDVYTATDAAGERDLLDWAQETLAKRPLYTWNGREFDLRFIVARLMLLRRPIIKDLARGWFLRWNTPEHYDVRYGLMGGAYKKGTLKEVAAAFQLPGADNIAFSGGDVSTLVNEQRWDELEAYCLQDTDWCRTLGVMSEEAFPE